MKIENVQIDKLKALHCKSVSVCIRITPEASKWLRAHNVSPTALFNVAMEKIGYKPNTAEIVTLKED